MVNPDHQHLIEDVHKANDRLMMLLDTIAVMPGADACYLRVAQQQLVCCMNAIEEAMPR